MFLSNLSEQQKPAFLSLAQALITADGVLSKDETAMMEQYRQEMGLSADVPMPAETESIYTFQAAPPSVKKQIIFELVALACADNDYADEERGLLGKLCGVWGLDTTFLDDCDPCIRELTAVYERIAKLVSE